MFFYRKYTNYIKNKYAFLNEEKERLENQLKEYNSKYDLKIEPRVVYYHKIYETVNSYYYDQESYYSKNILYDKIKRENIRNINFNEIEPEKILKGIDNPAILVYSNSVRISKDEIKKINIL